MALFDRIEFLENDLNLVRPYVRQNNLESPESTLGGFNKHLDRKFKSLTLATWDNRIAGHIGPLPRLPALTDTEKQHLQQDKTLFTSRSNQQGGADLFIAVNMSSAHSNPGILYGEIRPDYLWGGDDLLDPITELGTFNENGLLLFSSQADRAPFRELEEARRDDYQSGLFEWNDGEETYLAAYWTLFLRPTYLNSLVLVYSESKNHVLQPITSFSRTFLLVVLLTFWIVLFLSFSQIRRSMGPIEQLQEATRRIRSKDFTGRVQIKSGDEFQELGMSFNEMTDGLQNHLHIMNMINQIGVSLSSEKSDCRLLKIVLDGAREAVHADGAALYLANDDSKMELAMMHVCSLDLWIEKSNNLSMNLYAIMKAFNASPDLISRSINIRDLYSTEDAGFIHFKSFDANAHFHSQSLISMPLKNHEDEIIGILQLINALDRATGTVIEFSSEDHRLLESLASQLAVALTKNRLVREFKELFEGLTELIGTAIDEKSPYTGGHCKRVPVLSLMLAEAVSKLDAGPFREFTLSPEEEYELKIAALLHDCGKVTTPVHIADKATKLEAIVDRIELIRTRFEVLKRDKQVELLRNLVSSNRECSQNLAGIDDEVARFSRQLDSDLEFLENCNFGAESMPADNQNRIQEIAGKYVLETSTGISKPSLTPDEVYNLSVKSGTLTPKERDIVSEHIVTGIRMLESLRYPKSLRNVPVHAGSHHERFDGKGYPAGLLGNQITIQGRIIAIADIFEALTAADRPYKKMKTLSEALKILRSMRDEGQIDPDLYDVFINEKIYLRYARQFLLSDQIDAA